MYDINFFKNSYNLKKKITSQTLSSSDTKVIEKELEYLRDKKPTLFNIETTNYCNMKCVMCPRTIYMQRKNIWINDELFEKMLDNEIILGNVNDESLEDIWNGKNYENLRKMHITGDFPKGHKCIEKCDQVKLFEYLKKK